MSVNGNGADAHKEPSTDDGRTSLDSERLSLDSVHNGSQNGHSPTNGDDIDDTEDDPIAKLQRELERTREEKDTLATQYRNLLAKLTTMRTTLGNKLKQDAEELDRREQEVQHLTVQNEDLTSTVETLKNELIESHKESERSAKELDSMRSRALEENAQETILRERQLREAQTELEQCRIERDEWERSSLQEKTLSDDLKSSVETYKRELEIEREARDRELAELEAEREKSLNLQSVLQDFQIAKDHELKQAVKDYESQLTQVTQSLAEFKHRALTAEIQLEESTTNASRTQELEKEVKEKNLLIGKLRHEAVILNEHLMEALRRLRRNSTDFNVDRRLVTNVLLSFLSTPRADSKRFEMLSLLATVLSWSDSEREKAGLQRVNYAAKSMDLEKTDETESFSRLWVEFLLTEAAAGESPSGLGQYPSSPPQRKSSLPSTPTGMTHTSGPPKLTTSASTRRLASYTTSPPPPSLTEAGFRFTPGILEHNPPWTSFQDFLVSNFSGQLRIGQCANNPAFISDLEPEPVPEPPITITQLPAEILSLIFSTEPDDQPVCRIEEPFIRRLPRRSLAVRKRLDPVLLSHVCKQWRDITTSNPLLWSSFFVLCNLKTQTLELIKLWLERSADMPLDITFKECLVDLKADEEWSKPPQNPMTPQVMELLTAQAHRWKTIDFEFSLQISSVLQEMPVDSFKILESANFRSRRATNVRFDGVGPLEKVWPAFHSSPMFHSAHYEMEYVRANLLEIPWSRLTSVDVVVPILDLFTVLSECQNLVKLVYTDPLARYPSHVLQDRDQPRPDMKPVVLPSLRHLSMTVCSPPDEIFQNFTLPNLTSVHIRQNNIWLKRPDPYAFTNLLTRSECNLRSFSYNSLGSPVAEELLTEILASPSLSFVENLSIDVHLTNTFADWIVDGPGKTALPRLQTLQFVRSMMEPGTLGKVVSTMKTECKDLYSFHAQYWIRHEADLIALVELKDQGLVIKA
ncbi:hypothetical protein H0H93_005946 [Arthromyces matolae]|nr:hypothetical protein H0H93_005946 [Arthromyces matolae]